MPNKHLKKFNNVETKSIEALNQFELTIQRLQQDNEELATLHANVDEDIERLQNLKENIATRIANNSNAINGLERVLKGE